MSQKRFFSSNAVLGGIILLVGVLLTLDNVLDFPAFSYLFRLWPLLLVVWGGSMILRRGGTLPKLIGAIIVLGGVALLVSNLTSWDIDFGDLWPLLLIALGLSVMFGARTGSSRVRIMVGPGSGGSGGGSNDEYIRRWAAMSGLDQKIASRTLRGGELTAVMAGMELDLRDAEMAGEEVELEIFALMSGIVLQVPAGWEVINEVMAVAGAVEDKTAGPGDRGGESPRRLVLRGTAVMAGVEVKH